jgi:hypothetical protein
MSHQCFTSIGALAAVIAVASLVQAPLAGQAPKINAPTTAGTTTWTPPRTPDGQPDLQGIWNNTVTTPLERPRALAGKEAFSDEELATVTTKQKRCLLYNLTLPTIRLV